jgi:ribosomal-protein-alanine N-acetyltransferase
MQKNTKQFIESERLIFRPLNEKDVYGDYSDWLNDPDVCEGNRHAIFPQSQTALSDYIKQAEIYNKQVFLAILLRSNNRHIGNVSLQSIDFFNRTADLAILLGAKDCWGQGYGMEAVVAMIEYGFQRLGLRRITCGTLANNIGMQKIALKSGFRHEGTRRSAVYKNGKFHDILEYGILTGEFQRTNKSTQNQK